MKKQLFRLMVLILLLAILIPSVFLERYIPVSASDDTITRAEWIQKLVTLFDMTVEQNNMPDDYFFDVGTSSPYYRDVMVAAEFGVVDIDAGSSFYPQEPLTRDFAAHTMNYCLGFMPEENDNYNFNDIESIIYPDDAFIAVRQHWFELENGNFLPEKYVTQIEMRFIFDDAAAVLASTEIDENHENTYEFENGVVEIPEWVYFTEDENGIITIYNCPKTISAGQKFVVYLNEIPKAYIAQSVNVSGLETIIVTKSEDADKIITEADAQGMVLADLSLAEPIEDAVITFIPDESAQFSRAGGSVNIPGKLEIKKDIAIMSGAKVSVNVQISKMRVDYKYETKNSYAYVALNAEANLNVSGSFNFLEMGGIPKNIELARIPVAYVGYVTVSLEYSIEGTIKLTYKCDATVGLEYSNNGGFRTVGSFKKKEFTLNTEIKLKAGIDLSLGFDIIGVLKGKIYAKVGAEMRITKKTYNDGSQPNSCEHRVGFLYAKIGADAKLDLVILKKSYKYNYDIFTEKNSPVQIVYHYENNKKEPVGICTRGKNDPDFYGKGYYTSTNSKYMPVSGGYGISGDWRTGTGTVVPVFKYTTSSYQATITGISVIPANLVIPSELDGYPVVAIGANAFSNQTALVSVIIPDSVTSISTRAFDGCTNLNSVILSKNLITLGYQSFRNTKILSIEIPKSLVTANYQYSGGTEGPFGSNSTLKNVTFEASTTKIPGSLFSSCTGLESIVIPNGVTSIGDYAFRGCTSLRSATMPSGLTSIGIGIFYDCIMLNNITISDSLLAINEYTFNGCISLQNMIIPDSVTSIGTRAFDGCTNLSSVILSKNLITLGYQSFRNTKILSIEIPKSLATANYQYSGGTEGPFGSNSTLKNVTFEAGITKIPGSLFSSCTGLESIVIPNGVTSIGDYAFRGCTSLRSATMPSGLTSIGAGVFYDCSVLNNVVIPDSVTAIEASAFRECIALNNITISENIVTMGECLFCNCTALKNMIIPNNVMIIGTRAFDGCTNLSSVILPKNLLSLGYQSFRNTKILSIEIPKSLATANYQYSGGTEGPFGSNSTLKNVTFEAGTTKILGSLFSSCTGLESIVIPNGVTSIGDYAFRGCTSLRSVTMSSGLTSIGAGVFYDCSVLNNVTIPNGMISIGNDVFRECTALNNITMPDSIKTIGESAFRNCKALRSVTIPRGVTAINVYTFDGCNNLISVTIPNNTTSIGNYAFRECTVLNNVVIPKNITTIGNYAFFNNKALSNITIPSSVTSIGTNVFEGCTSLQTAAVNSSGPIGNRAFYGCEELTALSLADTVTSIGTYLCYGNKKLANVTLGQYTPSIPDSAFRLCPALVSINIPRFCASIAANAFAENTGLTTVYIPPSVSSIQTNSFSYPSKMTIYGKSGSAAQTYSNSNSIAFIPVNAPITSFSFKNSQMESDRSKTFFIPLIISPAFDTDTITFSSSNTSVATVNAATGSVNTRAYGTAVITATNGTITATCVLIVKVPEVVVVTYGDVSGDGSIDLTDLVKLSRHIAEIEPITDTELLSFADVTGDGKVTVADLIRLARWLADIDKTPLGK